MVRKSNAIIGMRIEYETKREMNNFVLKSQLRNKIKGFCHNKYGLRIYGIK